MKPWFSIWFDMVDLTAALQWERKPGQRRGFREERKVSSVLLQFSFIRVFPVNVQEAGRYVGLKLEGEQGQRPGVYLHVYSGQKKCSKPPELRGSSWRGPRVTERDHQNHGGSTFQWGGGGWHFQVLRNSHVRETEKCAFHLVIEEVIEGKEAGQVAY